jgi:hypothetical protein
VPTPIAAYEVDSGGVNTDLLTTPSFTPANGEVLVAKVTTWDTAVPAGAVSGGGLTWTKRREAAPGGFNGYAAVWTATVTGSPGSMAVTSAALGSNAWHHMVVERWGSAVLDASPAVNSVVNGSGAPAADITTEADGSVVTWCSVDELSRDPADRAYRLSAVEDGIYDGHAPVNTVMYFAYASVGAAGTYTMGMTFPDNQAWALVGVEVQGAAAVDEGVLAGTLPDLTAAFAAAASDDAVLTATLPALAGSLAGDGAALAQLDGALPALGGSMAAAASVNGVLAGSLPLLVGQLSQTPPSAWPRTTTSSRAGRATSTRRIGRHTQTTPAGR